MKMLESSLFNMHISNKHLKKSYEKAIDLFKSEVLKGVIQGRIMDAAEFKSIIGFVNGRDKFNDFSILIIDALDFSIDKYMDIPNIILSCSLQTNTYYIYVLLLDAKYNELNLENFFRSDVRVVISSPCNDLETIRKGFFAAVYYMQSEMPEPGIKKINPIRHENNDYISSVNKYVQRLEAEMLGGNIEESIKILNHLFDKYIHNAIHPVYAQYIYFDIVAAIIHVYDTGLPLTGEQIDVLLINADADNIKKLDIIKKYIEKWIHLNTSKTSEKRLMQNIILYVDKFLIDPNLDINMISKMIGYSYKYTSKIFKETTGERLSDYITKKRIERFKILAGSLDTTAQIVNNIGFNSISTFNRVFKHYEGVTPKQYRELIMLKS